MFKVPAAERWCEWFDWTVWPRTDDGILPSSTYIHVSGSDGVRQICLWDSRKCRGRVVPNHGRESSGCNGATPRTWGRRTLHSLGDPQVTRHWPNILEETRERSSGRRQITSSDGSHLHHRVSKSSYDTGYDMPEEPALPLALGQNQTNPHSKSSTLIMHLIPVCVIAAHDAEEKVKPIVAMSSFPNTWITNSECPHCRERRNHDKQGTFAVRVSAQSCENVAATQWTCWLGVICPGQTPYVSGLNPVTSCDDVPGC